MEAAYTNFELAWGELPGVQIGYVADDGGGLGGKGDTIYIFDGNTSSANIVDTEGYGNHEPKLIESTHVSLPDGTWRGWDNDTPEHDVYTNTDLAGFDGGTLGSLCYGLAGRAALVPIGNQWSAEQAALDPGGDGYWYVTLIGSPGLVSTIVGDANCDGCVNSGDLDIVRGNWGTSVGGGLAMGDFNLDGVVNSGDLDIVRANWGSTASATAVPEPATLLLILCGFGAALLRRTR